MSWPPWTTRANAPADGGVRVVNEPTINAQTPEIDGPRRRTPCAPVPPPRPRAPSSGATDVQRTEVGGRGGTGAQTGHRGRRGSPGRASAVALGLWAPLASKSEVNVRNRAINFLVESTGRILETKRQRARGLGVLERRCASPIELPLPAPLHLHRARHGAVRLEGLSALWLSAGPRYHRCALVSLVWVQRLPQHEDLLVLPVHDGPAS